MKGDAIMSDTLQTVLRFSIYFYELIFFIVITRKLFWEKCSFLKVVGAAILSPVTSVFLGNLLAVSFMDDISGASSGELVMFGVLFILIQTISLLIFLAGYVKFVKAKNPSIALFIFLCYSLMVPNLVFDVILVHPTVIFILQGVLVILFYVILVRPLSKLTKERMVTNPKLFILLPVLTTVYNMITFAMTMIVYYKETIAEDDIKAIIATIKKAVEDEATLEDMRVKLRQIYLVSLGGTLDLLYYPILFIILVLIIAFAVIVKNIEYMNQVTKAKDELHELNREVMEALAHTIDAKDEYTKGHSTRVAKYARMIAERMGLDEEKCENVYYMGLLHDIGKIAVPNEIINKKSKLTEEEYGVIKVHTNKGYEILAEIKSRPNLALGAEFHHERVDGQGYPTQRKGEDIPIEARIIAVADSYDAMTSNRSYRNFLPQDKVREELLNNIGTQFDETPAKCMVEIMDEDKEYQLHE